MSKAKRPTLLDKPTKSKKAAKDLDLAAAVAPRLVEVTPLSRAVKEGRWDLMDWASFSNDALLEAYRAIQALEFDLPEPNLRVSSAMDAEDSGLSLPFPARSVRGTGIRTVVGERDAQNAMLAELLTPSVGRGNGKAGEQELKNRVEAVMKAARERAMTAPLEQVFLPWLMLTEELGKRGVKAEAKLTTEDLRAALDQHPGFGILDALADCVEPDALIHSMSGRGVVSIRAEQPSSGGFSMGSWADQEAVKALLDSAREIRARCGIVPGALVGVLRHGGVTPWPVIFIHPLVREASYKTTRHGSASLGVPLPMNQSDGVWRELYIGPEEASLLVTLMGAGRPTVEGDRPAEGLRSSDQQQDQAVPAEGPGASDDCINRPSRGPMILHCIALATGRHGRCVLALGHGPRNLHKDAEGREWDDLLNYSPQSGPAHHGAERITYIDGAHLPLILGRLRRLEVGLLQLKTHVGWSHSQNCSGIQQGTRCDCGMAELDQAVHGIKQDLAKESDEKAKAMEAARGTRISERGA